MTTVVVHCATCGAPCRKKASHVNRSRKLGMKFFCDKACFGVSRRREDPRSPEEKRAAKAEYDAIRRAQLREEIREQKREYHESTWSLEKGRAMRERAKARGYSHSDYCRRYMRRPGKSEEKRRYDQKRRSMLYMHGHPAWAECHMLLVALKKEIRSRQPWYERAKERGYYDRTAQERKRNAGISRH